MKKHGKRIIAALLSVLMIVTAMAPNAPVDILRTLSVAYDITKVIFFVIRLDSIGSHIVVEWLKLLLCDYYR